MVEVEVKNWVTGWYILQEEGKRESDIQEDTKHCLLGLEW